MRSLKASLHNLLVAPLALVLVFEEWGWEPLSRALAWLARLPLWGRVERLVQGLSRWGALQVVGVPVLALLPIMLLALVLFGTGDFVLGLVAGRLRSLRDVALTAQQRQRVLAGVAHVAAQRGLGLFGKAVP